MKRFIPTAVVICAMGVGAIGCQMNSDTPAPKPADPNRTPSGNMQPSQAPGVSADPAASPGPVDQSGAVAPRGSDSSMGNQGKPPTTQPQQP